MIVPPLIDAPESTVACDPLPILFQGSIPYPQVPPKTPKRLKSKRATLLAGRQIAPKKPLRAGVFARRLTPTHYAHLPPDDDAALANDVQKRSGKTDAPIGSSCPISAIEVEKRKSRKVLSLRPCSKSHLWDSKPGTERTDVPMKIKRRRK
jgi:hypothetical protein